MEQFSSGASAQERANRHFVTKANKKRPRTEDWASNVVRAVTRSVVATDKATQELVADNLRAAADARASALLPDAELAAWARRWQLALAENCEQIAEEMSFGAS